MRHRDACSTIPRKYRSTRSRSFSGLRNARWGGMMRILISPTAWRQPLALYHSGRVRGLLLSGDNGSRGYDEPADMKNSLMALGVPGGAITLDDAGFRTLDSVVRAKEVFGQRRLTIITDRFHCFRAVFLAPALRNRRGGVSVARGGIALLGQIACPRNAGRRQGLSGPVRPAHPAQIPRRSHRGAVGGALIVAFRARCSTTSGSP